MRSGSQATTTATCVLIVPAAGELQSSPPSADAINSYAAWGGGKTRAGLERNGGASSTTPNRKNGRARGRPPDWAQWSPSFLSRPTELIFCQATRRSARRRLQKKSGGSSGWQRYRLRRAVGKSALPGSAACMNVQ